MKTIVLPYYNKQDYLLVMCHILMSQLLTGTLALIDSRISILQFQCRVGPQKRKSNNPYIEPRVVPEKNCLSVADSLSCGLLGAPFIWCLNKYEFPETLVCYDAETKQIHR